MQERGIEVVVDGTPVLVDDERLTLLEVLREQLGVRSAKDGCSPQGQCGCCTVLVDEQPRVACVTPIRRVHGRRITTLDGLDASVRDNWARAFAVSGASQCGFCTPGIICRFAALAAKGADHDDTAVAARALSGHLCRCTGWQPILDAWVAYPRLAANASEGSSDIGDAVTVSDELAGDDLPRAEGTGSQTTYGAAGIGGLAEDDRSLAEGPSSKSADAVRFAAREVTRSRAVLSVSGEAKNAVVGPADGQRVDADRRAGIEGRSPQSTGPHVALGQGGFADDTAPVGALVAVRGAPGCDAADEHGWVVAPSVAEARRLAGRVPGRRTTASWAPPLLAPEGDWCVTLRTSWVEPAYLETDSAWCEPGGEPASLLGNGGAFGGKLDSPLAEVARRLADQYDQPVRVLWSRPDTVEFGPKRPPMAAGVRGDGTGEVIVARTAGIASAIQAQAPGLQVTEVDLPGPPTSAQVRGAGWVEAAVLLAAACGEVGWITAPDGGSARAQVQADDTITVGVRAGRPLDETVLRSYCTGAAHMAYSWVTSESLGVDPAGNIHDFTVRSFGIVSASRMPAVEVTVVDDGSEPVNGSDAVFAAVAAAIWIKRETPPVWPTDHPHLRR